MKRHHHDWIPGRLFRCRECGQWRIPGQAKTYTERSAAEKDLKAVGYLAQKRGDAP